MSNVTLPNEIAIIDCLLNTVISAGYCVTVFDGEFVVIKRSTNREEIKESLNSTGTDWLRILSQEDTYHIGSIELIYNNGNNGNDLISNTASADDSAFDALLKPVYNLIDSL